MKDLEDVYSYISVANKLKRNGKTFTFTDARVVEKILQSLTDDFENVVCAIESQETWPLMISHVLLKHMNNEKKKKTRSLGGSLTNKDNHQRIQGDVHAT